MISNTSLQSAMKQGTKRLRFDDPGAASILDRLEAKSDELPPILLANEVLSNFSLEWLCALGSTTILPQSVEHAVVPEWLEVVSLGPKPELRFGDKFLKHEKAQRLLWRIYAKDHSFKFIIECNDGLIGVPNYRFETTVFRTATRTVRLDRLASAQPFVELAVTYFEDDAAISCATMSTFTTALNSVVTLSPAAQDALLDTLAGLTDLTDLGEVEKTIGDLKQKSRGIAELFIGVRLARVPFEDFVEKLQKDPLGRSSNVRLLAHHPGFLTPIPAKAKAHVFGMDGLEVTACAIENLRDDDDVPCTGVYVTEAAVMGIQPGLLVYPKPVYSGRQGKGRDKWERSDRQLSEHFIKGRLLKAISVLLTPVARATSAAENGVSSSRKSSSVDDDDRI